MNIGSAVDRQRLSAALAFPLVVVSLACSTPAPNAPLDLDTARVSDPELLACLEQPAVQAHFEDITARILEKWQIPPGTPPDQSAQVSLQISEGGEVAAAEVVHATPPAFEASVVEAISAAEPLPSVPDAASCMRGRVLVAEFQNPEAEVRGAPASKPSSGTYIRRVGARGRFNATYLLHWPVRKMPLAVYLPPPPEGLFEKPEAVHAAVRGGVVGWTGVVRPGLPGFHFVDSHAEADIPIVWAEEPDGDWYIAFCSYQARTTTMRFGVEQILVTGRWGDGRIATPEEIGQVVLHEMGHALGLMGHSDDPRDIMYPTAVARERPGLSERDRATLRELYSRGNRQIRGKRGRPGI